MNWVSTVPDRNCWLLSTFCRKGMLVCGSRSGWGQHAVSMREKQKEVGGAGPLRQRFSPQPVF